MDFQIQDNFLKTLIYYEALYHKIFHELYFYLEILNVMAAGMHL